MTELEMIQNELLPLVKAKQGESYLNHICLGEFTSRPGVIGCFEYNNDWFLYINDDRMPNTMFNGPYSAEKCLFALAVRSNVYKELMKYEFTEDERKIYRENIFSSFDEIDKYYEEKLGDSYISPRSNQVKYKYYKSNIGSGVLRRDGLRVELLSKAGEWEERKDLLTKFIGGDCDLDEIPEELALVIAEERKAKTRAK